MSGVENGSIVVARGLSRVYGSGAAARRAVDGVDLEVGRGQIVLVFGPSGSGKSTLLALLGGLDRNYTGRLELFGRDVAALGDRELSELRSKKLGFVFQAFVLLPHLSALDNVAIPALFERDARRAAEVERRALELLERVGLDDRAAALPDELSGGQRQRVAIARALFHRPDLLLCDEPTGNLDRETGEQIVDLFATIARELATTLIIVTHEDRLLRLGGKKLEMLDGRLSALDG